MLNCKLTYIFLHFLSNYVLTHSIYKTIFGLNYSSKIATLPHFYHGGIFYGTQDAFQVLCPWRSAALLAMSGSAISQEEEKPRTESADTTATLPPLTDILEEVVVLEELVVIGSRAQPRSVAESAVPIDVVTGEDFVKQGDTDVQNLLRDMVPSYNVNTNPISDASTVVRPPSMRGLAPDHTLVLINNKRRHRAAVIHWITNGVADGAQGPDIAPIPSIAIKRVEVLRDGASAQYGSDAIAGVLNFELKDNYKGGSFEVKPGVFQQGDGFAYAFAGNIGLGTPDAWVNLSAEYGNEDETDRSVQRDDAARLIRVGNTRVENPAQIWGQPYIRDDLKLFANYGININDNVKIYGHGNYASKEVEGGFYFRNPNTRGGVFRGPVVMWDGTTYYDPGKAAELGIVDGVNGNLVATLLTGNLSQVSNLPQILALEFPRSSSWPLAAVSRMQQPYNAFSTIPIGSHSRNSSPVASRPDLARLWMIAPFWRVSRERKG